MHTVYVILYVVAALLFALTGFGLVVERVNLLALGLLAWVLVPLIMTAKH